MLQNILSELREKYDFSNTQLEKMFGLGRGSYANLEKNKDQKVNPKLLVRIVKVYNALGESLTLEKLIGTEDDKTAIENEDGALSEMQLKSNSDKIDIVNDHRLIKALDNTLIQMLTIRLINNGPDLISKINI